MYIAYSALRTEEKDLNNNDAWARYQGYRAACQKHNETIAAIQKYLPGWQPSFHQELNNK
ncbi:hypothetical protein HQ865_01520 [Mucilaginibacter mali]|uniref:Uncharacterized protein n=1 Tax=Mucilaginibacter mali TaxID=2740462 RepID=A0A7D4QCY3_9SPHI|nr:hypothetical protein [Mucilaginibacter mali]QKJ28492.1 hypothetical protein HQ865_01520 [Mucilaginibacter mali]